MACFMGLHVGLVYVGTHSMCCWDECVQEVEVVIVAIIQQLLLSYNVGTLMHFSQMTIATTNFLWTHTILVVVSSQGFYSFLGFTND